MKTFNKIVFTVMAAFLFMQCISENKSQKGVTYENTVRYAKGFSIRNHKGYSILTVINPWPKADKTYTYILKEKKGIVPDSLKQNPIISIPIKKIVVTSTTHIPSLEMLNEVNSLVGFPHLDYIHPRKYVPVLMPEK